MESRVKKKNISIILVETQIPENIGAVARAMKNMDIRRLILVNPKNLDSKRIDKTATTHSSHLIKKMEIYNDLGTALNPFQYIVGTTARIGTMRPALTTPQGLAGDLITISQNNMIAILFGPEDRGLSNEDLRYCHTITTIPTSGFSSLNLAQAVMIICYEIFKASSEVRDKNIPRMANSFELEGMYEHLREVLLKIGFLNPQNPDHWMLYIRRFLSRHHLRAKEARIIRGICRQIDWYTSRKDRLNGKDKKD
jgi:tRNA/rRNA methyltransferase